MWIYLILPIMTGVSIVLQGGLNRASADQMGLLSAVLLNALVFLVLATTLWALARFGILSLPEQMGAGSFRSLQLWQLWPGLFGFLIVLLVPWSIMHLGAGLTFSLVIATQLIVSILWDSLRGHGLPGTGMWIGIALVLAGAILILRSSNVTN